MAKVSNLANGFDIYNLYLKLLKSFHLPVEDNLDENDTSGSTAIEKVKQVEDSINLVTDGAAALCNMQGVEVPSDAELQFYLTDEKGIVKNSKIIMNEPVAVTGVSGRLYVLVCWPEKLVQQYDTRRLSSLPEIFKPGFLSKRPQESVSLYKCLEAFLTEEPLGPEDMWSVSASVLF